MDIYVANRPLTGRIRAISSKSDVHRFLFAAALADGRSSVHFTTLSDDIKASIAALRALGADISLSGTDGGYTAEIDGIAEPKRDALLDAAECGTTARLLLPVAAALGGSFTLTGKPGLAARPFDALCTALATHGARLNRDRLPITGRGRLQSGVYRIRGDVSSQYISGLLFALPRLAGDSEIALTAPLVSAGYVDMTLDTLARFGVRIEKTTGGFSIPGGQTFTPVRDYTAEGDWSNAGYFLAAGALGGNVTVEGLFAGSRQRDRRLLDLLMQAGAAVTRHPDGGITVSGGRLRGIDADGEDIPDALPMLVGVLATAAGESRITGAARLRLKESDRIATTAAMLTALGGDVTGGSDGFAVRGKCLGGGTVDAANDHRIVMTAAVLAAATEGGVTIRGAEAVNKSYPTFFEDLQKLGGETNVVTHG